MRLEHPIRRISDHGVEAALGEDGFEFFGPVEGVDFVAGVVVEGGQVGLGVKVGTDEAVAAFDVVAEVGEHAVEVHLFALEFAGFAFEDLEEEGELRDLNGLRAMSTP